MFSTKKLTKVGRRGSNPTLEFKSNRLVPAACWISRIQCVKRGMAGKRQEQDGENSRQIISRGLGEATLIAIV